MFFLLGLSWLVLSLPLLGLCSKSTSFSPRFFVYRPRQYDAICWEFMDSVYVGQGSAIRFVGIFWVLCIYAKAIQCNLWGVWSFFRFFSSSWLIVCVDGVNGCGWCLAGDRMLTQGLVPDPNCKLNISSFPTLLHVLDCLICAKNIIIIVCYCKWWEDENLGGGSHMLGFEWEDRWWVVSYFLYLLLYFCAVVNCCFKTGAW